MIFSTELLKNNKSDKSIFQETVLPDYENKSFYIESLQYILEESKEFNAQLIQFNLNENGSSGLDSFIALLKRIDPIKIIKNILTLFIKAIDKIFKEFHVMWINGCSQDSIVFKYKKKILSYDEYILFDDSRYIYTNLGTNTSFISYKTSLDKEFSDLILKLNEFKSWTTYEQLYKTLDKINNENDPTNIDRSLGFKRGEALGSRNIIDEENFPTELFKYFRNNGSPLPASTVSPEEYHNICEDHFNYKKDLNRIEKDKKDMTVYATQLQTKFNSLKLDDYIGKENITPDAQKIFVEMLKNEATFIKSLSDIYIKLFSAKIDAVKEKYITDNKILVEVVKSIIREEKE
jgi:hypothetical protein